MQGDGIAAAFCHGNGIAEMSEPLRNIQLRIGRPFHGGLSRRPAATQKVLVRHPDLAEMVAINRVTRRKSDGQHLIPNTRQNLQGVYETGARALEGQVQYAVLGWGDVLKNLHGRCVYPLGIGSNVKRRNRQSVNGETDAAQGFALETGFGKIEVEFVGSRTEWDLIHELAFPSAAKDFRILRACNLAGIAAKGFAALKVAVREPEMACFVDIIALMIARQNAYSLCLSWRNGSSARFVLRRIGCLRNNSFRCSLLSRVFRIG